MKNIFKIVLTGGPCGGKTTAISTICESLTGLGYYVLVISETATLLISSGIKPFGTAALKVIDFQRCVLKTQIQREQIYLEIAEKIPRDKIVVIMDRGMLDGKAFLSDEEFSIISSEVGITEQEILNSYDIVLHLVTAADGAEEFYTLENNKSRTETPKEAIARDRKNIECWKNHRNFKVIDNSTDFQGKMNRLMKEIYSELKEPAVLDEQRRFLVQSVNLSDISEAIQCVVTEITQDYLAETGSNQLRLIRKCYALGDYYYVLIEKYKSVGDKTYRKERLISYPEYQNLLGQKDYSLSTIKKKRISFVYESQHFELDLFDEKNGLVLLQVGTSNANGTINIPHFINVVRDVTNDSRYRNYNIAKEIT